MQYGCNVRKVCGNGSAMAAACIKRTSISTPSDSYKPKPTSQIAISVAGQV
jgi:hypothetical protein